MPGFERQKPNPGPHLERNIDGAGVKPGKGIIESTNVEGAAHVQPAGGRGLYGVVFEKGR